MSSFLKIKTVDKIFVIFLYILFVGWSLSWFTVFSKKIQKITIFSKTRTILTNNLDTCYSKIEANPRIQKGRVCYDHTQNNKYLSCHFSIAASDKTEYVLVVGSSSPQARIFINELQNNKIPFREIKSKAQFNISEEFNMLILYQLSLRCIVDFSRPSGRSLLVDFANDRKVPLFHLVAKPQNQNGIYELLVPELVFGPVYFNLNTTSFMRQVASKLDGKNETFDYEPNDVFGSAHEIAVHIYETIFAGSYIAPSLIKRKFKSFRAQDILDMIDGKKEMDDSILADLYYIQTMRIQPDVPYASFSAVVSNEDEIIERVSVAMKLYENVLPLYPEASFELIYLFVHTVDKSDDFWHVFKPGDLLKQHIRVYEIQHKEYMKLLNVMNATMIPDYFIRNIGFRISRGEYIFSGSGDIVPSPFFFDACERKMFTPMAMYRSKRIDYNGTIDDDDMFYHYSQRNGMYEYDAILNDWPSAWHNAMWYVYTWGDMQGGHRKMVESIQGYVNDKYTYHIDNLFALDMSTFKPTPLVLTMPLCYHVAHKIVSQDTETFPLFTKPEYMEAFCKGQRTTTFKHLQRPHWGLEYKSERGTLSVNVTDTEINFVVI